MIMAVGSLPIVAEAVEEVPWAHIIDHEFEAYKRPVVPVPEPDPDQEIPWGVLRINADDVWDTWTGSGVKVAILDTGIDKDHPDLKYAGGVNFVPVRRRVDPTNFNDDNGHGTHVAGTIAAKNNEIGVVGVAPDASIYAVKVLDRTGSGYASWIISGIEWAITNNMDVISMSLGTSEDYPPLHTAITNAYNAGIVIVAAAGNDGSTVSYPAKYGEVIAVSATDITNTIASWSNRGAEIEVAAPGVSIKSTWNNGGYTTISGTSMACPHVTGVAALVIDKILTPEVTTFDVDDVWTALENAEDLGTPGEDDLYGHGLVDAALATT
ncbi:MAG: S8 family peptidase [Candidatus Thermoplasmatota archaeon]|nr:S8 family peptidase [Candidatus Thermoplasmatota archaeon]